MKVIFPDSNIGILFNLRSGTKAKTQIFC